MLESCKKTITKFISGRMHDRCSSIQPNVTALTSNWKNPTLYNYSICNQTLELIISHPFLGLHLQDDLGWSTHTGYLTSKSSCVQGIPDKIYPTVPKDLNRYLKSALITIIWSIQHHHGTLNKSTQVTKFRDQLQLFEKEIPIALKA